MLTVLTSTVHVLTAVEYMVYITNVLPLNINAIYGNGEHDHNYIFLNQQFINFTYDPVCWWTHWSNWLECCTSPNNGVD